jgi:hypothetical protein
MRRNGNEIHRTAVLLGAPSVAAVLPQRLLASWRFDDFVVVWKSVERLS